ncbi:SIR2 family NAD-dependent protein deacylase [Natronogracilivirga saccharolytica]|uniref:NAD-dependent protein deacylase n=1 Tax=Natronogracilivirga saccharolytica TaxID=2812953 RepID=A0A8J7RV90_9BACT|nr:NAD-dependent deacylase [Natronogracilivirga saccharolytica]MBP3193587.1 NAD-dependent deacylase [Natronogracilivirga saccharolytica]
MNLYNKEKAVALTGAGMSADSGITTFRDSGGLWEGVDVMEVASIEGWNRDPEKVLEFYNSRRRQLKEVQPNAGHLALKQLEKYYDVTIVTQNVDDLHERAGSSRIIHLHGELTKARPVNADGPVKDIGYDDIKPGDKDSEGRQLRPNIVWFGEMVPMMETAAREVARCDILLVIGTSLAVYPAAGLVDLTQPGTPVYVIDPKQPEFRFQSNVTFIQKTAAEGTPELVQDLIKKKKEH